MDIVLEGPAKNALSSAMMQSILARLDAANGEPVLLVGGGDAFSAGLDLKEVASLDAAGMERFLRLLERTMSALYLHPAPVVAAVNGHAIAGGCVLAQCCDHRVATGEPRVRVGLNEVALGVIFPPRVLHIVRERVPRASHEAAILSGALFGPDRAQALGLVDELAKDPIAVARERLAALSALPRATYAATKRAMRGVRDADLASDAVLDAWLRDSIATWTSDDVKKRVLAVLKK